MCVDAFERSFYCSGNSGPALRKEAEIYMFSLHCIVVSDSITIIKSSFRLGRFVAKCVVASWLDSFLSFSLSRSDARIFKAFVSRTPLRTFDHHHHHPPANCICFCSPGIFIRSTTAYAYLGKHSNSCFVLNAAWKWIFNAFVKFFRLVRNHF